MYRGVAPLIKQGCVKINKKTADLTERYSSCPSSQTEYEMDGKRYTVTRYFTGDKNLNKIVSELAISRADREAGLP